MTEERLAQMVRERQAARNWWRPFSRRKSSPLSQEQIKKSEIISGLENVLEAKRAGMNFMDDYQAMTELVNTRDLVPQFPRPIPVDDPFRKRASELSQELNK